jgi:hypothetical protein
MLVHNWREVLKRAWSVRLMALALLIIILEPVYLFVAATWVSHNIYIQLGMSMVTGLLAAAAIVARMVAYASDGAVAWVRHWLKIN